MRRHISASASRSPSAMRGARSASLSPTSIALHFKSAPRNPSSLMPLFLDPMGLRHRLDSGARPLRQRSVNIDLVLCRSLWKRFVSRLAHFHDELLEASRGAEQQHAHGSVALDLETMRDVARPENKCPRSGHRPLAVARKRYLAFEDIKGF